MDRTQDVGVLSKELAINAGISGPMARASGVDYDIRKVDRYGIYDRFNFRIPLGSHGDVYDRFMIRVLEMRESVDILQQAMRDIPEGPIVDPKTRFAASAPNRARPTHGSKGPRESSASISSATARPTHTAIACALPASSTSLFWKTYAWEEM